MFIVAIVPTGGTFKNSYLTGLDIGLKGLVNLWWSGSIPVVFLRSLTRPLAYKTNEKTLKA